MTEIKEKTWICKPVVIATVVAIRDVVKNGFHCKTFYCHSIDFFFFFFVLPAGWLLDRETRCFDEVRGTGQLLFGPVQFLGKSAIGWPNLSPQI